MAAFETVPHMTAEPLPLAAQAVARTHAPHLTVGRAICLGIDRGVLLAMALAGGFTFLAIPIFHPMILNFLLGALLVGGLASAISGLCELAWKLLTLLVGLVGRALSRKYGAKALAPAALMQRFPIATPGWIVAVVFLLAADGTELPFLSMIHLAIPTELMALFIVVGGALVSVALFATTRPAIRYSLLTAAVIINAVPLAWILHPGYDGYLARPDAAAIGRCPHSSSRIPPCPALTRSRR
jgi:hypothetical protein